jgi:hypothetical protein
MSMTRIISPTLIICHRSMMPEERKQDDDRQRDAEQP